MIVAQMSRKRHIIKLHVIKNETLCQSTCKTTPIPLITNFFEILGFIFIQYLSLTSTPHSSYQYPISIHYTV